MQQTNHRLHPTVNVNKSPTVHPSHFEPTWCHPAHLIQLLLQAQVLQR